MSLDDVATAAAAPSAPAEARVGYTATELHEDLVTFALQHRDGTATARGCTCKVCRGLRAQVAAHDRMKLRAEDLAETVRGLRLTLARLSPTRDAKGALWRVQGYSRTYFSEHLVHDDGVEVARDRMRDMFAAEGACVLVSHVFQTGDLTVTRYRFEHGQWNADVLKHWTGRPAR